MEIENNNANKSLIQQQIEDLLQKERISRQQSDAIESARILKQITQMCWDAQEYEEMFAQIISLSKKRGQSKKAIIDMVQLAMTFIDLLQNLDIKMKLILCLKEVCDKKIYLEVEYARCCLMQVKHKENEENINEAAKILQEVQVETYGSMNKREKLEFILYQMRIMIKKKDYVRLFIISKKINRKSIEDDGLEDLKITYYSYLIIYYIQENMYYEASVCYQSIFDTLHTKQQLQQTLPKILEFDFNIEIKNVLENFVMYLVISDYTPEQVTGLNKLIKNYQSTIEKHNLLHFLVKEMLSTQLISTNVKDYHLYETLEIFSPKCVNFEFHQQAFEKQLIQHNIRIVEKYYDKIYMKRLAELLNIQQQRAETELCTMINNKMVVAKIDRISGIIQFKPKKSDNEVLNEWVFDMNKVLDIVDKTCNYIIRDQELQKQLQQDVQQQ